MSNFWFPGRSNSDDSNKSGDSRAKANSDDSKAKAKSGDSKSKSLSDVDFENNNWLKNDTDVDNEDDIRTVDKNTKNANVYNSVIQKLT